LWVFIIFGGTGLCFTSFYLIWHRQIFQEFCAGESRFEILKHAEIQSPEINESSGFIHKSGHSFFTHNDDSDSAIYLISDQGKLQEKFFIPFPNRDWEDIARSEKGILFLGDFGNNFQKKILMKILMVDETRKKIVGLIQFQYLDDEGQKVNFDCEAMVYQRDSLFLFTKDKWERKSHVYALPARHGMHLAKRKQTIALKGMVTAAALRPDGKELSLLTYGKVYFFSLPNGLNAIPQPDFCLAKWDVRQSEALCYWGKDSLLLGNEQGNLFLLRRK
jgi:hypothetical protein